MLELIDSFFIVAYTIMTRMTTESENTKTRIYIQTDQANVSDKDQCNLCAIAVNCRKPSHNSLPNIA